MTDMHPVKSSQIHSVGQHGHDLLVRFHSGGRTYRYAGGGWHLDPMRAAESVGKYFAAYIKGKHEFTVEPAEASKA